MIKQPIQVKQTVTIEEEKTKEKVNNNMIRPDDTHHSDKPTFGTIHFLCYVWNRFINDLMLQRAAVLTLTSFVVGIPLSLVSFSCFTSFGIFFEFKTQLQNFIFANFLPQTANMLQKYIDTSITSTTDLTLIAIAFLLITSIVLLTNVINTFNQVWKVSEKKSPLSRFLVYWAILTLVPLLFLTSVLLSHYMLSLSTEHTNPITQIILQNIGFVVSFIFQVIGFTILFLIVPHFPVQRRNAILAGIITGFLFEVLRGLYIIYFTIFPPIHNIYTILYCVPISLLWMYCIWVSILFGAEITAALPEWYSVSKNLSFSTFSPSPHLLLYSILSVLHALLKATMTGTGHTNRDLLLETGLAPVMLVHATKELERFNFITRADDGSWFLTHELHGIKLYDLYTYLNLNLSSRKEDNTNQINSGWFVQLNQSIIELEHMIKKIMNIDLKNLLWDEQVEELIVKLKNKTIESND